MARNTVVKASIIADAKSFVQGVRSATAATDRFGRSTRRAGRDPFAGMAKSALKAAAAATSFYAVYDQGRKAINDTKELSKSTIQLTRTTGLSTQEASRFAAVTKVRGIEMTKLAASFTIFSKQIVAAQDGSEKASQAFKRLGVSQEALQRGNTKELFLQAADGLSKMENGARKTALAAQVFGRGYQALFPLLDMGGKGIAEQLQLAGDLGAELSGNSVEAFKKYAAAEREAKLATLGFRLQVGTYLLPILTDGIGVFQRWVKQFKSGQGPIAAVRDAVVEFGAALLPVAEFMMNHPKLVAGAIAAYLVFKATILSLNLYNALMTALGPVSLYGVSGKARGLVFGINFGAAMGVGAMIGFVALPVIVATALERVGAVFQQWATRNMGPELKRLLGVPLTLNPLESFGPWFENLKTMASQAWGFVKKVLSSNPLGANPFGKMSQWWDAIKKGAKGAIDFIKKLFGGGGSSNILGTIQAPKITGLAGIASAVKSAISAAIKAVLAFVGKFLAAGAKLAENLAEGVKSAAGAVIGGARSVVSGALRAARGLIPGFSDVGRSISQGLASGISSAVGSIVSAAQNAVKEAQAAARRQSESKSPSRVFAEIGEDLIAGMALGMSRTKPVVAAGLNVAKAAADGATTKPRTGDPVSDFLRDPITGGPGLDPMLSLQQQRLDQFQKMLDKARDDAGKKVSATERKRIDALRREVRSAQSAVTSLDREISRRDALQGIGEQINDFVSRAVDSFREVRAAAAQAARETADALAESTRNTAQAAADAVRNAAMARLDEATGDSPEAQRLRELRAEGERLAKEREDRTYAETKAQLEADLARATLNGNVRKQTELNAQLLELEQQRSDTLRTREEAELSASLQRQRDAAQTRYDEQSAAAQKAYDDQIALNQKAYDDEVAKNAAATQNFKDELAARLKAEVDSLNSRGQTYASFAAKVNAILANAGIAAGVDVGSFTPSPSDEAAVQRVSWKDQIAAWLRSKPRGSYDASDIGRAIGTTKANVWANKPSVSGYTIKNRVSGGALGAMTLVGETGPELVVGNQVMSSTRTNRLNAGGAGVTLNVYPRTTADDPDALARALGWQLATR